jgi:hypothetical protein
MTTVVKVDRRTNNYTLYIGRAWAGLPESKWHNPYHLQRCASLEVCLDLYEAHIRRHPELMAALHEIDDQILGCWCHENPDEDGLLYICHGDVLIKLRQEQKANERRIERASS